MASKDFRSDAVAASQALLRAKSVGVPLLKAGISCCVPQQPDRTALRTRIKIITVVAAVFGFGGLAAGGIIGGMMKHRFIADNPMLLTFAVCCSVGGILFLFLPTTSEKSLVRRYLQQAAPTQLSNAGAQGLHVAVEEASSYGQLKVLAEDVGLLYFFPRDHMIKIDGLSYQYVIHGRDVVRLQLHRNRKTVLLSYAIGEQVLELAIIPRSIRAELRRQTLGSSNSLYDVIASALQVPAATPA